MVEESESILSLNAGYLLVDAASLEVLSVGLFQGWYTVKEERQGKRNG